MFQAKKGDREDVPNVMFVITDGKSDNKTDTLLRAKEAKARGIRYVVCKIFCS